MNNTIFFDLKKLMTEKEITIKELSEQTGISRTTIYNILNQKNKGVSFNTLKRLCEALECTPNALLKIEEKIIIDERFDSYIDDLKKGHNVTINAYIYGDFLRYVEYIGRDTLELFRKQFRSRPLYISDVPSIETWIETK